MWAKPFKPPTMRGMTGRPQQKKQEEEEVMVVEATPSPPGSPKLDATKTSPTKENDIVDLEGDEDEQPRGNWKPKRKLLYIDHPPTERLPVKEALARSRQRANAPMKPLVSRVDLADRMKEKEAEESVGGPEGYFRVLWYALSRIIDLKRREKADDS